MKIPGFSKQAINLGAELPVDFTPTVGEAYYVIFEQEGKEVRGVAVLGARVTRTDGGPPVDTWVPQGIYVNPGPVRVKSVDIIERAYRATLDAVIRGTDE